MRLVKQFNEKLWKFHIFRVGGGENGQFGFAFLTWNIRFAQFGLGLLSWNKRNACLSWPVDTCWKTKEYMTNLGMGRSRVTITHILAPEYCKIVTYM